MTAVHDWDLTNIRVLHVDDEPDFAELSATFLERENEQLIVTTATSAREGLERLTEHDIDCIVSDYDMAGRNGIEFLEAVRQDYPDLPFILYTGKGSEAVASDAISAGVTDYLQKETGTSQYTVLANRITNTVEQYRSRLEQQRRRERRNRQGDALFELTLDDAVIAGDLDTALERITELAADVLAVPRVNIWLFNDERDTLRCVDHFDRSAGVHERGAELTAEKFPRYIEALGSSRSVAVADAVADPRTKELVEYLEEHDVRALLDATIRSEGEVVGVVCHENVGEPRTWTDDETEFAIDIADLVHRALRNRDHVERTHELEESRIRLRALTENTAHAIVTIDEESVVRYANDAIEEILGYTPQELVDGSLLTIVPERFRERHREAVSRYLREGTGQLDWDWIELPGLHRDGSEVPLGISFGEAAIDGERRFTAVIRDITERKESERKQKRQSERLEQFAGVVSHDLRNPLSVVRGSLELARLEYDDENLQRASLALDRAFELIQDLLILAYEREASTDAGPVELASLATSSWQNVDTGDATLKTDVSGAIRSDERQLRRLFENLFRNAVEHGGTAVTVTVGGLDDGFYVEDDGIGIPPEKRNSVLDAGYTTSEKGTGFGFTIIEQVVAAHGWEIGIAEGPEGGARFELTGVEFVPK